MNILYLFFLFYLYIPFESINYFMHFYVLGKKILLYVWNIYNFFWTIQTWVFFMWSPPPSPPPQNPFFNGSLRYLTFLLYTSHRNKVLSIFNRLIHNWNKNIINLYIYIYVYIYIYNVNLFKILNDECYMNRKQKIKT